MTRSLRWLLLPFIAVIFIGGNVFAQSFKSESELRKNAEKDFKNEDYAAALPLYSQLLSLNQRDAKLNYRYGVCLLMADKDKSSAYNYLEFASHSSQTETEVFFYMAKALQLKYRFDDAIADYTEFAKRAGGITAKKFDTDHQIETCRNAKELLRNPLNTVVKSSKEISANALYSAYEVTDGSGKLLTTPEMFLSPLDKKKITSPMMYLSTDGQTVYYASYGKNDDNGKDIYVIHKQPSGSWGSPENLGVSVNTKYDEDYPYMDADGKTLYFSSKGHNSMGGYDMFKTTYNAFDNTWSEPVNLGAGINSPDDDFFYMPLGDGEAQFASAKETVVGMLTVYRIEVAKNQKALASVHGKFKSLDHPERTDAKISVLRKSDNGLVATTRTDQRTGEYELAVPAGDDYEIVVQGGGYMAHVENFTLPSYDRTIVIAQQINMNRANGTEQLEIRNQYLQSDSNAVVAVALPKETQVIKDEYAVDKVSEMKLTPITVDGQVVYATKPAAKDSTAMNTVNTTAPESISEKAQDIRDAVAVADKQEPAASQSQPEVKKESGYTVVTEAKPDPSKETTEKSNELSNENKNGKQDDVSDKNESETAANVIDSLANEERVADEKAGNGKMESSNPKSPEYKANISDKELVKIAYNDAKEMDQEAKSLAADASVAHANAQVKDSVSRSELKQMIEVLKKGDQATAQELSRESQLNADSAGQARAHAADLDEQAKTKQIAADKALADARELEKNTGKQGANKTALNKSKTKTKSDKKKEANKEEKENATTSIARPAGETVNDSENKSGASPAADNVKAADIAKGKEQVQQAVPGEVAVKNESKPQAETTTTDAKSNEVKTPNAIDQKTVTGTIDTTTSNKTDASTAVVPASENKIIATVSTPVTSAEANKNADELKAEAADLKTQSIALKEEAKKTTDEELKKVLVKQADNNAQQSQEKSKEADQQLAIAKELKKKEEASVEQATTSTSSTTENKNTTTVPVADQTAVGTQGTEDKSAAASNVKASPAVVKDAAQGSSDASKTVNTDIAEAKKPEVENTSTPVAKKTDAEEERTFNPPATQTEEAKHTETSATSVRDEEKSAELLKGIPAETVNSYKDYLNTKNESDKEARQATAIQAKIETMAASAERDQLAQQANDLNMQSIKSWQKAQAKLNAIKEADPIAERKLSEAFPPTVVSEPEPISIIQPKNVPQPKDTLMSEAVTHRVAAENAPDKSTETDELKKTKDLIIQSKDSKQVADKNKSFSYSNSSAATDVNASSSSSSENKAARQADGNNAAVNTPVKAAKQGVVHGEVISKETNTPKEALSTASAKESREGANSSASNFAPDNVTPVLSEKTLNVEEGAIYSISPTPIYTTANPIPMDPKLPEGLVFKVQIGAFHNPLPVEAFKNVQPLSGETTRPGWIRYCVGLFRTFEPANVIKMEMRSEGYKDAFVVAYYNGKRISLFDAYAIINHSGTHEKELYAVASEKEAHHLSTMNIKESDYAMNNDVDAASFYGTSATTPKIDESLIEYAVQVGVFKNSAVPKKLQALIPLNVESYKTALYRFTTGRFTARDQADSLRRVAVNTGVKDAFVVIYKGGKRAGENVTSTLTNSSTTNGASASGSSTASVDNKIIYRIQVGAYKFAFSDDQIASLKLRFKTDISQSATPTGLHLLYAGSYSDYTAAILYKKFLVSNGANDAFVVAFSGNTKIPVQKALQQTGK